MAFDFVDDSMHGAAWSLPLQLISLLYTRFGDWYEHTTPLSQSIFVASLLGSSALTLYGILYLKRRRGENVRAIALLAIMLLILAGLILSLPLSSGDILHQRDGGDVIPNIRDPNAVNPQSVCPGYKVTNVASTPLGLTADLILAGDACNVYGNDIEALRLVAEAQADDRLHIEILPKYVGQNNQSWFILPDELLPKPKVEIEVASQSGLVFSLSNNPTLEFKVTRKSTGDVLFSTGGSKLVYEDQFIEFGSALPENYNLYGLGETIHGFRLGNNLTSMY
jgi:alpha-glucosidase